MQLRLCLCRCTPSPHPCASPDATLFTLTCRWVLGGRPLGHLSRPRAAAPKPVGPVSGAPTVLNRARSTKSDKFLYVWRRRSPISSASERALPHGHDSDAQRTRMMRQGHQGVDLDGSSHPAGQYDVRSNNEWSMVAGRVDAVVSRRSLPPGLSWSVTKRHRRRNGLTPRQHAWAASAELSEAAAAQDLVADSSTSRLVSDSHRCQQSGAGVAKCARTLSKSDPDPVHGSYRDP